MEAARRRGRRRRAAEHAVPVPGLPLAAQQRLTHVAGRLAAEGRREALPHGLESELLAEFDAVRSVGQRPRWYWMTAGGLAIAASIIAGILLARAPWGLTGQPEFANPPVSAKIVTPDPTPRVENSRRNRAPQPRPAGTAEAFPQADDAPFPGRGSHRGSLRNHSLYDAPRSQ